MWAVFLSYISTWVCSSGYKPFCHQTSISRNSVELPDRRDATLFPTLSAIRNNFQVLPACSRWPFGPPVVSPSFRFYATAICLKPARQMLPTSERRFLRQGCRVSVMCEFWKLTAILVKRMFPLTRLNETAIRCSTTVENLSAGSQASFETIVQCLEKQAVYRDDCGNHQWNATVMSHILHWT